MRIDSLWCFLCIDIYITMVSHAHAVCAEGLYIVIISTDVETENPEQEIAPALAIVGEVKEMFIQISDIHEPTNDAVAENLHITKSYDATSHFETSSKDVLAIYEKITGTKLDLNIQPDGNDEDYWALWEEWLSKGWRSSQSVALIYKVHNLLLPAKTLL